MKRVSDYLIRLDKTYLFDEEYNIIIDESDVINSENIEDLYQEFLKIKEIEIGLINDLKRIRGYYCFKTSKVIYSIQIYEFELNNISKYTSSVINEKYITHLKILKDLLEHSNFEKYLESIPKDLRVYKFIEFTRKPQKSTLLYHWRNGKELWELDDKKFWEYVRFLWTNYSDDVSSNRQYWLELFTNTRNYKEYFMNLEERQFLENLPDEFEVFRGYSRSKPSEKMKLENLGFWDKQWFGDMGFSYTLSKDIGMKYSDKYKIYNREFDDTNYYKMENDLYHGLIKKSDVLFYFNGRKENEIIIVKTHGHYVF
jgi:hypothetical protein